MPSELLVTGCYRSGTTLLEKLLHAHPEACIASQPFPGLYSYAKGLFDESRGLTRRYPLGHRFLEDGYTDADLAEFLDARSLTKADIDAVFEQLVRYGQGLWTPEILRLRESLTPGPFIDVYAQLMQEIPRLLAREQARVIGTKEILVEEYVPYLLERGRSVILIVRDPRDMIASLNFSERDNATGDARPVLYSIRVWRKSVACALAFEGHPRFQWLRYEDLVAATPAVMTGLHQFLGLPALPERVFSQPVRDQRGDAWQGNSSFRDQAGVSKESVGRFRDVLPPPVQAMIEATAAPEMSLLGYDAGPQPASAIQGYRDPFSRIHAKFAPDYSSDASRVAHEIERLALLASPNALTDPEATHWFIYPAAYHRLRQACGQA